ncbi:MAG: DUF3078 domain-containing protein [Ignavibacteriota bacterium]
MRNKIVILILLTLIVSANMYAQPTADTTFKMGWTPKGSVSINLSQISFDNWTQGGENSLAFSSIGNFDAFYRSKEWFLANRLKLAYGRSKSSNRYFTTDNELRLENVLIRNFGWKINPYFSNEIRTGLANGFDYKVSPEQQITAFFDPGYITQSLGFIYARKVFNTRLGVGLQETFTNRFNFYSDDAKTLEVEKFKIETGVESVSEANFEFMKNMNYTGRLRLFSRFNTLDVWDVNWDNIITAKINDYFNVNFNFNFIYQQDQSVKAQYKEALQLGFSYVIF